MPRKTRAAMRAEAEALNVTTEDASVNAEPAPETPTKVDRSPLADIDSNSVDGGVSTKDEPEQQLEVEDVKASKRSKSTKGKKAKAGKKGPKSKEVDAVEDGGAEAAESATTEEPAVAEVEDETAQATVGIKKQAMTTYDKLEAIVTTPPTRHTRSRLGKEESEKQTTTELEEGQVEQKVLLLEHPSHPEEPATPTDDIESSVPDLSSHEPKSSSQLESQDGDAPTTSQGASQPYGGPLVQADFVAIPAAPVSQPRAEDSIDAIDAMEEEFEKVNKMIPQVDITSPEKPTKPHTLTREKVAGPKYATAKMTEAFKARKAAAATAATAASRKPVTSGKPAARQGAPGNGILNPKASSSLSKQDSNSSASSSRKASASEEAKDGKSTDYLASRRRPISMHFPAPPPPAKSTKAPTKSTFTLPGEAVAAKLKAAREQRLKREEEEAQKRREFKARPIRASIAPVSVKATAASRARESLMHGGETASNKENVALRRSGSVGAAATSKRSSTIASSTASKRASVAVVPGPAGPSSFSKSLHGPAAAKRSSVIAANTSKPRAAPSFAASTTSAMMGPRASNNHHTGSSADVASSSSSSNNPVAVRNSYVAGRGREIFNRDRVEKERREQERRDKEDAAKTARLAAAERGRQASREWAEKAKAKKEAEAAARAAAAAQSVPPAVAMGEEVGHARLKAL